MQFISKQKALHWTAHARAKMRYYGLSESRVKRILHSPARVEEGVAPKTIAVMQKAGSKAHPTELWAMVEETPLRRKVVSAWRYPGVTKSRDQLKTVIRGEYDEYVADEK